jgi:hypothetical protein
MPRHYLPGVHGSGLPRNLQVRPRGSVSPGGLKDVQLGIPVTMGEVPGGQLFSRSTDEDVQQAEEVGPRLKTA